MERNMATKDDVSGLQASVQKCEDSVTQITARLSILEAQMNTAQETAQFVRVEAKVLASQSSADTASTRSSPSSVAPFTRWRSRSSGPASLPSSFT
eukprot:3776553-Pyramimonas_sp.AAC.1